MRALLGVILALAIGGGVAAGGFALAHLRSQSGSSGSGGPFTTADYRHELNDICRRTMQDMEQVALPTAVAGIPDYFDELVQTAATDEEQILQFPVPSQLTAGATQLKTYVREHKRLISEWAKRTRRARTVPQLKRLLVSFVKRDKRIKAGIHAAAGKLGLSHDCGV
jgi:hypothetical protein